MPTAGDPGDGYPPKLARLTASPPEAYRIVRYGPSPEQYGEYWPGGHGAAVVLIHGGYWRARVRLDVMHLLAADLNARGYAVWNIEYRRMDMPGGGWPGTFEDVAAALDAVADLGDGAVDLARVGLIGHSAGGHLALWAASRSAGASAVRVVPTLVVSLAGVCDLAVAARLGLSDGAVSELLGGGPDERPEVYRQADPAALAPLGVPQLVVHGTADTDVPRELSERYAAAAGPEATLLGLPGVDHFQIIDPDTAAWARIAQELTRLLPAARAKLQQSSHIPEFGVEALVHRRPRICHSRRPAGTRLAPDDSLHHGHMPGPPEPEALIVVNHASRMATSATRIILNCSSYTTGSAKSFVFCVS